MPYKIALTSTDGKTIDLHFGHTDSFKILQVDENSGAWEYIEDRTIKEPESACAIADSNSCGEESGCGGHGHNMDRLNAVIECISGCSYVLTSRIGPKPSEVLKRAGITALEAPADLSIAVQKLHAYHLRYSQLNKEN
jgi:predicted Fe-Mo cluster-binding NifX family protein